jgi:hypothetical protein
MRFFQKRKEESDVEVRGSGDDYTQYGDRHPGGLTHQKKAPSYADENRHPGHRGNGQPVAQTSERTVSIDVEDPKKKLSFAELVRKLNCAAASVKDDAMDVQQRYIVGVETSAAPPKRTSSWGGPLRKSRSKSDIMRPVLITVNDGEYEEHAPQDEYRMAEMKSSFIIGEMPPSVRTVSPFKIGMSARKVHSERSNNGNGRDAKNNNNNNFRVWNYGGAKSNLAVRDTDAIRTAQEIARKERWRRGMEMEQRAGRYSRGSRDDQIDGNDSIVSADQRTEGSYNTRNTGEYSSVGPDTLTTVTDNTDESYDSDTGHLRRPFPGQYGGMGTPSCRQYAVQGVAEDLGIVARLLLSDGSACFSIASAITSETVANCRDGRL